MEKQLTFWIDVLRVIDMDAVESGNYLRAAECRNLQQGLYVDNVNDFEYCLKIIEMVKPRVMALIADSSDCGNHNIHKK
jgi:hypothetical protein